MTELIERLRTAARFGARDRAAIEATACWQAADRIAQLEAALRDVLTFADITKPVDADALTAKVRAAWQVLGSVSEMVSKQPDPLAAHSPKCWKRQYNAEGRCDCGVETSAEPEGWNCKACGTFHAKGHLRCLNPTCPSYQANRK